jgi:hypothetical protein
MEESHSWLWFAADDEAEPPLPNAGGRRHQITQAGVRGLGRIGLGGGDLSESRCQRLTEAEFKSGDGGDGQADYHHPDSHETARKAICFHAPTLVLKAPRVLIERIYRFIDRTDEP